MDLCLPPQFSGLGVNRHDEAIRCCEVNHVLVDRQALAAREQGATDRISHFLRVISKIFPNQITVGGVDGLDAGPGRDDKHDTVMHDGRRFIGARRQAPYEGELHLPDIRLVDLVKRTEALLVISAIEHQPVATVGLLQHAIGDRPELGGL